MNPKEARNNIDKHMLADGMSQIIDLNKSHGSWLVDARDNREYLDLFSMFASLSVGYNHPYLIANKERLMSSALNKPTNSDVYSVEMAEFVSTMGRVAQPDYLPYAFYIEGGGLAVENALKTAFDWKVRKNLSNGKGEKGTKIIHFKECFHGRTGYTMSLTDSPDPRKTLYFPQFDWPRIDNPKIDFPLEKNLDTIIQREQKAIDQIKDAIMNNPDDIAGLIIEPIQGEGGDNHFRKEFLMELRNLADESEFLLIFDEVQTGVGVTGHMWAHQAFEGEVKPDIISFGKKTQVCGIFASERLDEVENNVFHESSRLNSTWGGSLVDMVRFTIYLEIIENENLVQNAHTVGQHLSTCLDTLQSNHRDLVSNSRNRGLFGAFDLPDSDIRDKVIDSITQEGVMMLGCGKNSIRFRPHLNITPSELDQGFEMIHRALNKL
ncbi:MAG: L-lysine 6-transaminase [Candidatus Neomarinimicrobiota bacterium]|jgi:L-lysine 6-transaminase|nr:L-lysine 6-transaminase [Candidatus Neomarinimicrobiota bacterium]MEC9436906.1 L-lysine 6-transaminase [Candidatus Neomarinimicrobiota bacterium]MEC9475356.1 L-lysine 6-transaminase [Candidatus Neomarinimicrobiota bacterium]